MTNQAVVILTDPAQCQLAEAETLVRALLQVQQLNNAGVPASQAFCDHPGAAMEFIDAYSKAYPALQLRTSDLPPPQHLYSMVADGRLSPLRPLEAAETPKPDQPGQPHPLYVLSLGAPEALMQALQYNQLANSSIRVLEIAPVEQANAEPVSVAEAVAAAPLTRSSWGAESSRTHDWVDRGAPGTEQLSEDPVKLSSVEVDLDRIQIDSAGERQTHDQSHEVQGAPASAIITAVGGPGPSSTSVGQTMAEVPGTSVGVSEPTSQPAGATTPSSESVSDTRLELPTNPSDTGIPRSDAPLVGAETPSDDGGDTADEPALSDVGPTDPSGMGVRRSDVPLVSAEPPGGDGADTPDEPALSDVGPADPPVGEPGEQDLAAGRDGPARTDPGLAQEEPEVDDAAAASQSVPESEGEDALARHSCTFATPGEDVLYQPSASFSGNSDLQYSLPADDAGAPSFAPFDLAWGAEVVDLEAVYTDLLEPAEGGKAEFKGFDFVLMRAPPNSDPADANDGPCAYLEADAPVTHDDPGQDEDKTLHDAVISVHDADV